MGYPLNSFTRAPCQTKRLDIDKIHDKKFDFVPCVQFLQDFQNFARKSLLMLQIRGGEAGVNVLQKPRKPFPKATNKLFPKSDA